MHLEIGERRQQNRIPVDQALAAIDETFAMQPDKGLDHRGGETGIHGKAVARPVDRVAQPAHLRGDRAAGLGFPGPDTLEEGFARHVSAMSPLEIQLPLDHHLGGDAGVIRSGLP